MKIRWVQALLALLFVFAVGVAFAAGEKKDLASEVESLKVQVAQLAHAVQNSQDYIAISNLETAYGYYIDKAQYDQAADLFARNGTLEIGLRGVWVGQDHVRAYLHKLPDYTYGTVFSHMQLQPVIDVAPDGLTAKGRWRAIINAGALNKSAEWGEGTYENEYVKEDGVWKIKKLHFYMTYYVNYYKGWDQGGDPAPGPIKDFPPDLPPTETYKLYPDIYIPPYHYKNPVTGK